MTNLKEQIHAEIKHHISPLIGWLRNDAAKGKVDTDGTRHDQWKERVALAVDAIMEHVGEVEYEYSVQTTDWRGKVVLVSDPLRRGFIDDELWVNDIESRQMLADWLNEQAKDDDNTYRVVKRRKAGRIEDV